MEDKTKEQMNKELSALHRRIAELESTIQHLQKQIDGRINIEEELLQISERLSFQNIDLTPKEILVADLIKDGKQDKEILEILNISLGTVKTHWRNIREKLAINNKKINLRTKLLSFIGR